MRVIGDCMMAVGREFTGYPTLVELRADCLQRMGTASATFRWVHREGGVIIVLLFLHLSAALAC